MAIRLRLPVVIEASLLAKATEIAIKAKSELKIEPCYQIRDGALVVEVDTHEEVVNFARIKADLPPVDGGETQPLNDMPTDYEITAAMIRYGGSFASRLGELYRAADARNQAKLKAAFPDVWKKYSEMAATLARRSEATR
jgi:hypothetical protein